ncbi:MAG TPA: ABC transporter permease [Kineosporiaceae bacterium]
MADTDTITRPATAPSTVSPDLDATSLRPPRRGGRAAARFQARALTLLRRTAVIAALLVVWEVAPRIRTGPDSYLVEPSLLPPFSRVAQAWWQLLLDGELWDNTQPSLVRSLSGFALAVGVGVPLGFAVAWSRHVRDLLNPALELFRNTAALALLPAFTLILGLGETSKIALVFYACLFPVVLNTITGVHTVDPLLIRCARSMGFHRVRLFRKVVLPAAVPSIFTGIRQAGAASILILLAAEMVGAKAGLGYLINYTQFNFMIPQMYAGIVTIAVLGLCFNATLVALERRASRWQTEANR